MLAERIPCLAYLRVSTERQAGETVTSLADQKKALGVLAASERIKGEIVESFEDGGVSGASVEGRPAFSAMRAYCRAHPRRKDRPGYVLALNASRFGRFDDPDEAVVLRHELKGLGWLVRFAESDDSEDMTGRHLMRAIGDAQASEYRRNIIRNAQRGKRGASELGYWTSREPWGYRRQVVGSARVLAPGQCKANDEKVRLTPGPAEEVAHVQWLFETYAAGSTSLGRLAEELMQRDSSRRWSRAVIRQVLINPVYLGDMVTGRRSGALVRQKVWRTDPSTWQRRHGTHEALISHELFDKVQRRLSENPRRRPNSHVDYKLTGLVRCAECGEPYVGGGLGGYLANGTRPRFYRETERAGTACDGYLGTVMQHLLEGAVIDTLAKEFREPAARAAIRRAVDAPPAESRANAERKARELELQRAESRRDRLVLAVADGTMTADEARTSLSIIRATVDRLRGAGEVPSSEKVPDAATVRAERDRLLRFALDFPRVAKLANGVQLRDMLAPWLAGATFHKRTRELVLQLRTVPLSLAVLHSPGPGSP